MSITLLMCAAAAAQSHGAMGPSRVALAAVPVCAAWSAVAYSLGRRQQVLRSKRACASSAAAQAAAIVCPCGFVILSRHADEDCRCSSRRLLPACDGDERLAERDVLTRISYDDRCQVRVLFTTLKLRAS